MFTVFVYSLYIHYPFCVRKCPYCAFASQQTDAFIESQYRQALLIELYSLSRQAPWSEGQAETLYFGGGTPSLADPAFIAGIIEQSQRSWRLPADAEVTLEANPASADLQRLGEFFSAGVNRLSIGAQSFNDAELATLGRIHRRKDIDEAVEAARRVGFQNISLDLMYGIPGQTSSSLDFSLRQAFELEVEHISAYSLSLEPDTEFERRCHEGRLKALDPDAAADFYDQICSSMADAGYKHYELTNYCREGFHSRHNCRYWRRLPYLGLGPGAHSFDGRRRFWNTSDVDEYIDRLKRGERGTKGQELITPEMEREETVYLSLRCGNGLDAASARRLTVPGAAEELLQSGHLELRAGRYHVVESRWLLLDDIVLRLLNK